MKTYLGMLASVAKIKAKKFFKDESGLTVVELVVLIGIAVLLAIIFKDAIKTLIETLMKTITSTATDAVSGN